MSDLCYLENFQKKIANSKIIGFFFFKSTLNAEIIQLIVKIRILDSINTMAWNAQP